MSIKNIRSLLKNREFLSRRRGDAVEAARLRAKNEAERRRAAKEAELLNAESALGRKIFGAVPEGQTREFFYHMKNAWIWYENGVTMRYEVRPHGVFKKVGGDGRYQEITGKELENFRQAAAAYLKLVKTHLYA